MLLCFSFLTETTTSIRRVNYRGGNTIPYREHALVCGLFFLEIGYQKPWKMCPKMSCSTGGLQSQNKPKSCVLWGRIGGSLAGAILSTPMVRAALTTRAQQWPRAQLQWPPWGQDPAWLGQQTLGEMGCSARGRLILHYTENCFSLCKVIILVNLTQASGAQSDLWHLLTPDSISVSLILSAL